jgi:hypothetical protein
LFLGIYKRDIIDQFNSVGISTVPQIICGYYVKERNGVLITGDHLISDIESDGSTRVLDTNCWDYYAQTMFPEHVEIFYLYTPEIAYAITRALDSSDLSDFKHRLFKCDFRPKLKPVYDEEFTAKYIAFAKEKKISRRNPEVLFSVGTKAEFLKYMDYWNK